MRNPTVSGDHCRSKSLIVSRTYSAEPGNKWVIPNRIITEKNGKSYLPILNPSVQSVVFPARKEIPGVEAIESTEWVTGREEVIGNFSLETSPPRSIPEFLRESLEKVPAEYRQEMETLLTRYQDLFHDTPFKSTNAADHETDTGDHQPIRSAPYRVSELEREAINTQVEEMLQAGIVKPSSSPWSSPVVMVPKKNGKLHFCPDYLRLNSITIRDFYPLPRIDDFLDHLGGAIVFTCLDLKSVYWQIPVDKSSQSKKSFVTPDGLSESTRLPFGFFNGPASFQRKMDQVLPGLKWNTCLVYLDDVVVCGKTFKEHQEIGWKVCFFSPAKCPIDCEREEMCLCPKTNPMFRTSGDS
jgi:hypothetical protein